MWSHAFLSFFIATWAVATSLFFFSVCQEEIEHFFGILVAEYLKWYECILSIINEYQAGFNGLPVHILYYKL